MRYTTGLLLIILLFTACQRSSKSEISKIEFAEGTCFIGPCVPTAMSIDSSLDFKYYADSTYDWLKHGHVVNYTGKASMKLWGELISKLEDIDYKHIDTAKRIVLMDAQQRELIIYWKGGKTRITYEDVKADSVILFVRDIYKQVRLLPTNDSLSFGTTLQLGVRKYKKH